MTKTKKTIETLDHIAQQACDNLNLSPKKAVQFSKQARALQKNLALRKKQKKEWEEQKKSCSKDTTH